MMRIHGPRWVAMSALVAGLALPWRAYAMFGEEDWLSGQNELLAEMVGYQADELAQISSLLETTRALVGSSNDLLALARTTKRVYDVIRGYDLEHLAADARRGLYKAMPELRRTEVEVNELVANGQAAERGEGAFFSQVTFHDSAVSSAARRSFEHGYQAAIWPLVFPDAMRFLPKPSPVELLIQERYRRTDDERRRAVQRTAIGVLAQKVKALVDDAESKDNAQLRTETANAEVNLQSMANLTEMRNIAEQDAAEKEAGRIGDQALRSGVARALEQSSGLLVTPPATKEETP